MSNNTLKSLSKSFTIARARTENALTNMAPTRELNFKYYKTALVAVAAIALFAFAFFLGKSFSNNTSQVSAPAPLATQNLNRTFKFPLKDADGKTVSQISYVIETANLQNAFIYQGKLATAVKGRTFLIFNLKITNPYSKSIQINARDYIRVEVNGSSEKMAPEIHNDPVQIDATSTKNTRVGLPINTTDKNIVLLVGELNGSKETIKLSLSQ